MARTIFKFSDGGELAEAVSYVELNPVKAGMVDFAWDYPWSSVHAHLSGCDELELVDTKKMSHFIDDWKSYLLKAQRHSIGKSPNQRY